MSATPQPSIPRSAYITLAVLFGLNLLNFTDRYILSFVLDKVQEPPPLGLGIKDTAAGFLGSIFLITYGVIGPFVGWLGDRVTRKYLLAASVAVWSLATFGTGLAQTYEQMLLARAILAVGEATYTAVAPTLIADLFPRNRRGMIITIFWLAVPLGAALGSLAAWVGLMLATWRETFYFVGLPGVALALVVLFLREPRRGEADLGPEATPAAGRPQVSWRRYLTLFRNKSFMLNLLAMAMYTFALGGLSHWAKRFLAEVPGLQDTITPLLGPILCVSGLAGMFLGGVAGERLSRRFVGAYFLVSGVSLLASVPFFLGVLLIRGDGVLLVYPCLLVALTLAFMNVGPSNTINANVSAPDIRVGAIAINLFFGRFLGDIPSQTLIGWVGEMTGDLFWGMALTVPAFLLGGVFYCLGTPFLKADQDEAARQAEAGLRL